MGDRVEQEAEIEDVLSSIRRLVSQNGQKDAGEALILTAAQRIEPGRIEPEVIEATSATVPGDFSATPRIEIHRSDIEELEAEISDQLGPPEAPYEDEHIGEAGIAPLALNQEELRELVVDIVRDELRGALGQKITRNVRKLVRQEIHRALNSRTLD